MKTAGDTTGKAGGRAGREVRRRALRDRIAAERVELGLDVARLREAASVSRIVRRALAPTVLGRWLGRAPRGTPDGARRAGWLSLALQGWRGWRRVAPVVALVGAIVRPLVGKRLSPLLGSLSGVFRRGVPHAGVRSLLPVATDPRRAGRLVRAGRRVGTALGALLSRRRA